MKKIILASLVSVFFVVGCEKLLPEYSTSEIPFFPALTPPGKDSGYQIHLKPFPIQPNFEREIYIRKALGNLETVYLTGFKMTARPGTHHLIAYDFNKNLKDLPPLDVMYDQNNPNNTLNLRSSWDAVPIFQSPAANYEFALPSGYALEMPANASFLMNSHYFNKTSKTRFGEFYMNFFTIPKNKVNHILQSVYYDGDVELSPKTNKTFSKDFIMTKKTIIPIMLSHYHQRGKKFEVRIKGGARNGKLIYESTYYEDPVVKTFATPIVLEAGEGLTSIVSYENNTEREIGWGVTSEDEMNIMICFQYNP